MDIEYELTYDIENEVLLIELENEQQCKEISKFIREKLPQLEKEGFRFLERGQYLDFILFQHQGGKGKEESKGKEEISVEGDKSIGETS
jgi:hypothetical protein